MLQDASSASICNQLRSAGNLHNAVGMHKSDELLPRDDMCADLHAMAWIQKVRCRETFWFGLSLIHDVVGHFEWLDN